MLDNRESATGVSLGIAIASNNFHPILSLPLGNISKIFPKEDGQQWNGCCLTNTDILWDG